MQVQASNDASLLCHKLFSLYDHIPRRCSSSSLSLYHSVSHEFLSLPFCLLRLYAEKTVRRRDSLLNTWPNQFFYRCRMVFIKLLYSSTMSKTSRLDRCSVNCMSRINFMFTCILYFMHWFGITNKYIRCIKIYKCMRTSLFQYSYDSNALERIIVVIRTKW